ncbi:hypothetical protein V9T40_006968 [Parthenolecanium corni]|uniref:Peptidase S1 domain-containing protein n=1 Tax=Parthenolecanium corni TaxID=536013 RepID=A0AAN9TXY9_9HEMI
MLLFSCRLKLKNFVVVYILETGVNQGDAGGGLLFPKTDLQGRDRYYLRGIASNRDKTLRSDGTTYISAFTDIAQHIEWMYSVQEKIEICKFNE